MMTALTPAQLAKQALEIRKRFLKMHFEAKAGHIGSGLSSIDLLTYFYWNWLEPRDRFILSKGHAASSLYATLNARGIFSDELLSTYYKDGTTLPVHPAARAHEEIPVATGSLGHGLPVANGMAYAVKYLGAPGGKVVALLSDGECNEGSVWEGALFAGHHRLGNLVVVIDANGIQGFGHTKEVLSNEPFAEKWRAFGFNVSEINGHDFAAIEGALRPSRTSPADERPTCVICRTVKGKGVSFMQDQMSWHYLPMTPEQYQQALQELEASGK